MFQRTWTHDQGPHPFKTIFAQFLGWSSKTSSVVDDDNEPSKTVDKMCSRTCWISTVSQPLIIAEAHIFFTQVQRGGLSTQKKTDLLTGQLL